MRSYFVLLILLGLLVACEKPQEKGSEKKVETIPVGDEISDIIRNPVSANEKRDTVNVAKLEFTEDFYDFGRITAGDKVEHLFKFQNTGKAPLLIADARSTCGCTIPEWPDNPIAPGEGGTIKVVFDSDGKEGQQHKTVTITANTYPSETKVKIRTFVLPRAN